MWISILGLLFTTALSASNQKNIPHLEFEMSGSEYQAMLSQRDDGEFESELEPVIRMGKRYLDWLKLVNSNRPAEKKLSLSSPETQPGYPIEEPKISSPKIILKLFSDLKNTLPQQIKESIFTNVSLTEKIPVSDDEFVLAGKKIDALYGMASRWILQEPYLWAYAAKKHSDIRGFYYLTNISDLQGKLSSWATLSNEDKSKYSEWLTSLCFNSGASMSACEKELQETLLQKGTPLPYYKAYLAAGEARWSELFHIETKREDIAWHANEPKLLKTPFSKTETVEVEDFLRTNIEDEWHWKDWQLKLDFIAGDMNTTHIEFVPGATPHVNGLAGSTITMDANQPLSEYHVRWTIRHEFGHTLGFPDCYVEFYDADKGVMISYQIDTTNIMCSRKGKLQEKHFEELKRVYYTP